MAVAPQNILIEHNEVFKCLQTAQMEAQTSE